MQRTRTLATRFIKSNVSSHRQIMSWPVSERLADSTRLDVWSVFSPAMGHVPSDSINLGQGYMNFLPPTFIREAATAALDSLPANHYNVPRGLLRLRQAISTRLSPSFKLGRAIDPLTEILATAGANLATYSFACAFLHDGDEVILFEPFFDQYAPQVTFSGGVPVYIPLHPPAAASTSVVSAADWKIDMNELRAAITPRTKMIWINSPHNPIGKVFDEEELRAIGNLAKEFNLMILSDEVYDEMALDDKKPHIRMASIDDFWERTITIGSGGKSFACTGWRVGWALGPEHLIQPTLAASTRIVFSANSIGQEATAVGLELAETNGFFEQQRQEYIERRTLMMEGLDALGLPYTVADGAYFIMVNTKSLQIPKDFVTPSMIDGRSRDWAVAWFIAQTAGVVVIPPTDFYSKPHWSFGEDYVRVAFCKDLDTLRAANGRLLRLKPFIH